jgi:hypothetical protein
MDSITHIWTAHPYFSFPSPTWLLPLTLALRNAANYLRFIFTNRNCRTGCIFVIKVIKVSQSSLTKREPPASIEVLRICLSSSSSGSENHPPVSITSPKGSTSISEDETDVHPPSPPQLSFRLLLVPTIMCLQVISQIHPPTPSFYRHTEYPSWSTSSSLTPCVSPVYEHPLWGGRHIFLLMIGWPCIIV